MLGMTVPDFLARSLSTGLPGYGRVFVGVSPSWGNGSFANIFQHAKSEIEGYSVKLQSDDIKKLDTLIGVPKMYNRIKIKMKKLPYNEGDPLIDGETYEMIDKAQLKQFKKPSVDYLDATCKTLSTSLFLRVGRYEDNVHELKLKVFKQTDISLD